MTELDQLDFFRDQNLVADPYPYMEAMRTGCPVRREPHHNVMVVTGYEEAVAVFGDSENFSSCTAVTGPFPGFPVPIEGQGDDVPHIIDEYREQLPFSDQVTVMDPPKHTAHRALLMGLITPKRLKENEDFMWRHADTVLDPYLAAGGDFIKGFAAPFTLAVIADLLGVPEEDRAEFAKHMDHSQGGVGSTGDKTLGHSPLEYLYQKFSAYIEDRRREPRADALTEMADAEVPRRLDAGGHGRRADRGQPVHRRAGDHGPAAEHRAEGARRGSRTAAAVAQRARPHPELHRRVPARREPGEG